MTWNFNMAEAPRGNTRIVASGKDSTREVHDRTIIIAAGACGTVTLSYWIDAWRRWNMFNSEPGPIAWMLYDASHTKIVISRTGKKTAVPDLPPHPTMAESWFAKALREKREGEAA